MVDCGYLVVLWNRYWIIPTHVAKGVIVSEKLQSLCKGYSEETSLSVWPFQLYYNMMPNKSYYVLIILREREREKMW